MTRPPELPTGTVTFLFTDIEGSTRLLRDLGERFPEVNETHLGILRGAIEETGGTTVRTEGDAFFAAFPTASSAVNAAVAAQRALADEQWPDDVAVSVRMGMHTGEGRLGGDDYVGIDVVRAARIADAGNGGQILLSEPTSALIAHDLPEGTMLRDLGSYELKDLEKPEPIREIVIDGLPQDFPPLRTRVVRGNLPERLSSFIGREELVADAAALLDGTRLLTLVGPGGTGKTRLSIRLAEEAAPTFPDGAFFVALSTITEADLVPSAILAAVGVRAPDTVSPLEHLLGSIRNKSLLLVLDNLEQIPGAAGLVAELLAAAPSLNVIATSRAPLGVAGEQEMLVPPMEVPEFDGGLDRLMDVESIRLFVERASAVVPGFALAEDNAAAVVELARQLDGLPLALELAANRVKVMRPAEILAQLGPRMLSGGGPDLEPRQQTMWNTVAWSYELLSPELAQLFRRMSVFEGGSRLAEIESVCQPTADLGLDPLDGLTSLIDQSLVLVRRLEETRYTMLHTLREFAADQLEGSELAAIEERHALAYLALVEEAQPELMGRDRRIWLDRLEREIDNLRTALDYLIENDRADEAMRFSFGAWRLWQARGLIHEGRVAVEQVLGMEGGEPANRMRANEAYGGLTYWLSDFEVMDAAYRTALDLARELGEPHEVAHALYNASFGPARLGDMLGAVELLEEAQGIYTRLGDDLGLMDVLWSLSLVRADSGDFEGALEVALEVTEVARRSGDDFRLAWSVYSAAYAAIQQGVPVAKEYLLESLQMFEAAGDLAGIAFSLGAFAILAMNDGDGEAAALLYGAAVAQTETSGTNVFLTDPGTEEERARLQALAVEYPKAYEGGLSLSTGEAIAAARKDA